MLEDGRTFRGEAYGSVGETFGEAVFTTGMTGYQETLTDPSYHRQVVVQTAPHIGNTGVNGEDDESGRIWVAGYVVRDPARIGSNWRATGGLEDRLAAEGVVGISGVDTRALTRHLRERGAMRVGISSVDDDPRALLARVRQAPQMVGADLSAEVTTAAAVRGRGRWASTGSPSPRSTWASSATCRAGWPPAGVTTHVLPAVVDHRRPARHRRRTRSSSRPARATRPPPTHPVALAREVLRRRVPLFGICFGSQILGRALGFGTYKLGYGHRGINQPVLDRATGKVEVTSHNHGFAVRRRPRRRGRPDQVIDTEFGGVEVSPRLPQRQRGRGAAGHGRARVHRPVPPGGGGRPARRGLPLRPLRRA